MQIEKIYGGPGTGKTTSLLKRLQQELTNGTNIKQIGFMGFTRAACSEALTRAKDVANFEDKRYWFMTIHATCLKLIRQKGIYQKVINWGDRRSFCIQNGLKLPISEQDAIAGDKISPGTAFFSTYNWLTNKILPDEDWRTCGLSEDLGDEEYPPLAEDWKNFKEERDKLDFGDMLKWAVSLRLKHPSKVLMVDEFQDLSPLQRNIILQFMENKERVYIAGDDDQALYRFQGAEPEGMLEFDSDTTTILNQSYRCPPEIFERATFLIEQNFMRQPKNIEPRKESIGQIFVRIGHTPNDLLHGEEQERVFILARTNYLVSKIGWKMSYAGIPFRYLDANKDRVLGWSRKKLSLLKKVLKFPHNSRMDYFDDMVWDKKISKGVASFLRGYVYRRNMIDPKSINIFLGTIHSAKGKEADTVILYDDITPRIAACFYDPRDLEDERRVWYVGMTRARERLYIARLSDTFFGLPEMIRMEDYT